MNPSTSLLLSLPNELSLIILKLLSPSSIYLLGLTSKRYLNYKTEPNFYPFRIPHKMIDIQVDVIKNGYFGLFKWLVSNDHDTIRRNRISFYPKLLNYLCIKAAEFDQPTILQYTLNLQTFCINDNNHRFNRSETEMESDTRNMVMPIMSSAAKGGSLDCVKLLFDLYGENYLPKDLCVNAAKNSDIEMLEWLKIHGKYACPLTNEVFTGAVIIGKIEVVKWLKENQCPCTFLVSVDAAEQGHFEILKYLREIGCQWTPLTAAGAAKAGRLDILKWLRSDDDGNILCPLDATACATAALEGHFEILQWLRENDCPWNEKTCANAALGGHFEILNWLHENGCPWNMMACANAVKIRRKDILEWLRSKDCRWTEPACSIAAENGDLDILRYLHENGCYWSSFAYVYAARNGHLDIMKYLYQNGCPWKYVPDDYASIAETTSFDTYLV